MFDRAIENWLDNAGERQYESAFLQLLAFEGHRIIRAPEHGPHEHGKDVVTCDRAGKVHAFQLKAGDISTKEWRQIRGEVNELVEVAINDPQLGTITRFRPALVTTGAIAEPVAHKIQLLNQGWAGRKLGRLETVERGALFSRFRAALGSFLPANLGDVQLFLKLFLAEGSEPVDTAALCGFFESFLPLDRKVRAGERRAAFAAAPIFAAMILASASRASNHLAESFGWTAVISYLLALADREPTARQSDWRPAVGIAVAAWRSAMERLLAEVPESGNWIAGNVLVDQPFVRHRKQLVLGALSALMLFCRSRGECHPGEDAVLLALLRGFEPTPFFGDAIAPALYASVLFLWVRGQERAAVEAAEAVVRFACRPPLAEFPRGIPDPYHTFEECLVARLFQPEALINEEHFGRRSFCTRQFVEFIARRNWRGPLKRLWYDITGADSAEFVPDPPLGFYRWRCPKGTVVSRQWGRPHYWGDLEASAWAAGDPNLLIFTDFPGLLLPVAIAVPQRFTPAVALRAELCLK